MISTKVGVLIAGAEGSTFRSSRPETLYEHLPAVAQGPTQAAHPDIPTIHHGSALK